MSDDRSLVPRRLTLIWKRCGASTLLVTPGGARVLLNPEASKVWELIDDRRSVSAIEELLNQDGGGSPAKVDELLESMHKAQVVTYESYLWTQE